MEKHNKSSDNFPHFKNSNKYKSSTGKCTAAGNQNIIQFVIYERKMNKWIL